MKKQKQLTLQEMNQLSDIDIIKLIMNEEPKEFKTFLLLSVDGNFYETTKKTRIDLIDNKGNAIISNLKAFRQTKKNDK